MRALIESARSVTNFIASRTSTQPAGESSIHPFIHSSAHPLHPLHSLHPFYPSAQAHYFSTRRTSSFVWNVLSNSFVHHHHHLLRAPTTIHKSCIEFMKAPSGPEKRFPTAPSSSSPDLLPPISVVGVCQRLRRCLFLAAWRWCCVTTSSLMAHHRMRTLG